MDEGARARRAAGRFGRAARAVVADASLRQALVAATRPTAKPASDSIAADLAADLAAVSGHSATSERQRKRHCIASKSLRLHTLLRHLWAERAEAPTLGTFYMCFEGLCDV